MTSFSFFTVENPYPATPPGECIWLCVAHPLKSRNFPNIEQFSPREEEQSTLNFQFTPLSTFASQISPLQTSRQMFLCLLGARGRSQHPHLLISPPFACESLSQTLCLATATPIVFVSKMATASRGLMKTTWAFPFFYKNCVAFSSKMTGRRTCFSAPESSEPETFEKMFRKSDFVKLGRPRGKLVAGKITHVVEQEDAVDLYVDFGWKFHAVVTEGKERKRYSA